MENIVPSSNFVYLPFSAISTIALSIKVKLNFSFPLNILLNTLLSFPNMLFDNKTKCKLK